ncbi:phage tail tape measure protein, partial [Nonlabens dokdonensis]
MAKRVSNEIFKFTFEIDGDDARNELSQLERANRKLNQSNKDLRAEKARLASQNKKGSEEWKRVTSALKSNTQTINLNKTRMGVLRKEIGITGLTMRQLKTEASKLSLQLQNMTPGTAAFDNLNAKLVTVKQRMQELNGKARASQSTLSRWANGFNKYQALTIGVIATLTGVVFQMQQIIDFNGKLSESQSNVMKTTGMTKEEVDDLAKSFGLLHSRTSRINLLGIAEQGGRMGLPKEEIKEFVDIMDKAGVALGDDFTGGSVEAARSLGVLKGLFKETRDLGIKETYNGIGSAINELAAKGLASADNLANFTKRVGAMPDALRPSIAEALGLGAAFEESGLEAEQSARAYSIFMTKSSKEVEKFAYVMGLTQDQVKEMINTDPTNFFLEFSQGLKGMDATDTAKTLDYLGLNADGVKKILGSAAANTQLFRDKFVLANDAMQEGTSLLAEYNIKNNNFQATLDKVGKRIRGVFASETVVKFLTGAVDAFAQFIGATETSSSSILYLRKTLVFLIKILLVAGTAVLSYKTAAQLATLWGNRLTLQTKLLAIAQKAAAFTTNLLKGAVYLLQIGYFRLTGQLAKARGAMVAFTMATNLNPLTALLAVLAAIGVAYLVFRDNAKAAKTQQDFLNDAIDEANVKTAAQSAKVKALDKVVRDETRSQKDREDAIKKLNKIVPNYNEDLDTSKTALENSKVALDQYIDSLKRQAQAQALNNLMNAKAKELEEAKQLSAEDTLNWMERQLQRFGGPTSRIFAQESDQLDKNVDKLEKELDVITKMYADIDSKQASQLTPLEKQLINLRAVRDDFKKGTAEYIKYQKQIDALTKKFRTPGDDDPDKDPKKAKEVDYLKLLRDQRYAAAEESARLIKDQFEREMELERLNNLKKIEELESYLIDTSKLKGEDLETALEINKNINDRIEIENATHQERVATILAGSIQNKQKSLQDGLARELEILKTSHNEELAAFVGTKVEREAKIKEQQQEELDLQSKHAHDMLVLLQQAQQQMEFNAMPLDMLSEEDKQTVIDRINQLKAKLAELGLAKSNLGKRDISSDPNFAQSVLGKVDIFGFTAQDWVTSFENIDTAVGKIEMLSMGLRSAGQIWGQVSNMLSAKEDRELQEYTQAQDRKRQALDNRLDRGFINKRQYNKAVEKLENDQAKKEAELKYQQAKRDKITALAGITTSTGLAVMRTIAAYAAIPGGAAIAAKINIANIAQGAIQAGLVAATPLPAKGYEKGLYPIQREQDGKIFNARYGGGSSSGLVTRPTYF